jgi:MHS family citrate/tricarballylate:H+ symporter-like MFS transporter
MTAATTANGWPGKSKLGAVLRVTSGNFLEQFDFFLFGFYATYLAKTFFPWRSQELTRVRSRKWTQSFDA